MTFLGCILRGIDALSVHAKVVKMHRGKQLSKNATIIFCSICRAWPTAARRRSKPTHSGYRGPATSIYTASIQSILLPVNWSFSGVWKGQALVDGG